MHAAVDSGCDEKVHQMCELPNYGRVPVATEVMALCRPSGDGRALRTHAPLAMERRTVYSGLSVGREESWQIEFHEIRDTSEECTSPLTWNVTFRSASFTEWLGRPIVCLRHRPAPGPDSAWQDCATKGW